jgi:hypothetical protein
MAKEKRCEGNPGGCWFGLLVLEKAGWPRACGSGFSRDLLRVAAGKIADRVGSHKSPARQAGLDAGNRCEATERVLVWVVGVGKDRLAAGLWERLQSRSFAGGRGKDRRQSRLPQKPSPASGS